MDSQLIEYSKLKPFNVSRETFQDLEKYRKLILEKNKEINLISSKSEQYSRERHIIDCAQIIDFIDKNSTSCTDIGSGSGLPGIVLAIIMKHKKSTMKFTLYEKSYHKSIFLNEISKKFNLNINVIQKNIFDEKNLVSDLIVARAFKPLPIILNLIDENFKKFKKIILFLGETGKSNLSEIQKKWKIDYEIKESLTNKDSIIIIIKNLKKK